MTPPTTIQFQQLQRMLRNFNFPIPIHTRQDSNGVIQLDAGNPYIVRDSDTMDIILNDLMDVDDSIEPDELLDEVLGLFDLHANR